MGADAGCTRPDQTVGVGEEAEHCLEATVIRELVSLTGIFETRC